MQRVVVRSKWLDGQRRWIMKGMPADVAPPGIHYVLPHRLSYFYIVKFYSGKRLFGKTWHFIAATTYMYYQLVSIARCAIRDKSVSIEWHSATGKRIVKVCELPSAEPESPGRPSVHGQDYTEVYGCATVNFVFEKQCDQATGRTTGFFGCINFPFSSSVRLTLLHSIRYRHHLRTEVSISSPVHSPISWQQRAIIASSSSVASNEMPILRMLAVNATLVDSYCI